MPKARALGTAGSRLYRVILTPFGVSLGITNAGVVCRLGLKYRPYVLTNSGQDSNFGNFRNTLVSRVMTAFWPARDYWPISSIYLSLVESLAALEREKGPLSRPFLGLLSESKKQPRLAGRPGRIRTCDITVMSGSF
jgi:hypothetical protein